METVTITFNSSSPFAANLAAFLSQAPADVAVTHGPATAKRKRKSNYEITLETIKEAREGKNVTHYTSFEEFKQKMHAL